MVAIPSHVASLAGPSPHSVRPDRGGGLEGDFPMKTVYDNSTTGITVSFWYYKKSGTTYDKGYGTLFTYTPQRIDTHPLMMATPWLTCARAQGMQTCG